MRLCGLVLCKRILLALLLDKVSQGYGAAPLGAAPRQPSILFPIKPTHRNKMEDKL